MGMLSETQQRFLPMERASKKMKKTRTGTVNN
jgi:hypothetical protein